MSLISRRRAQLGRAEYDCFGADAISFRRAPADVIETEVGLYRDYDDYETGAYAPRAALISLTAPIMRAAITFDHAARFELSRLEPESLHRYAAIDAASECQYATFKAFYRHLFLARAHGAIHSLEHCARRTDASDALSLFSISADDCRCRLLPSSTPTLMPRRRSSIGDGVMPRSR